MILLVLMVGPLKLGVAILLLLSVIAIFVSPAADLAPSALRAAKMVNLIYAVMLLAGTAVIARLQQAASPVAAIFEEECAPRPAPDLLDLNCTRLC
jgi:hypothetical protein